MEKLLDARAARTCLGIMATGALVASPAHAATRVVLCEEFTNQY